MSFRDRMKVAVSRAEDQLAIELQHRGLADGMQRQVGIPFTYPDFLYQQKRLAIYLDGPPHLKSHQIIKDQRIDEMLIHLGYTVLRFPYKTMTKTRLKEIVDQIEETLHGKP